MTWSVNASGHCDTAEQEEKVMDAFRSAVASAKENGTCSATAYGSHAGGNVDLVSNSDSQEN